MEILFDLLILVGLLVIGVPVPFCFMAAVLFMFILGGYDPMFMMATGFHKTNSMAVLAILFFIVHGMGKLFLMSEIQLIAFTPCNMMQPVSYIPYK